MTGDAEISGNTAKTLGGGVYIASSTVSIGGGEISGNSATSESNSKGGGIYLDEGYSITIRNVEISGNEARDGAGIFVAGTLTLENVEIEGNEASNHGGGIYINTTESSAAKLR